MYPNRVYAKIDLDAIESNISAIRARAGVDVMAVIKADAALVTEETGFHKIFVLPRVVV